MKRLFQLNTNPVSFFESKVDAKKARGQLVQPKAKSVTDKDISDKPTAAHYELTVSKGPDHIGNHGRRVPQTRHRAPQDFK